jgi:hypothetical protein
VRCIPVQRLDDNDIAVMDAGTGPGGSIAERFIAMSRSFGTAAHVAGGTIMMDSGAVQPSPAALAP